MKQIEKWASDWTMDCPCMPSEHSERCVQNAFQAGFKKAREMAADMIDPCMDSRYLGDLRDEIHALGEEE